MPTRSPRPDRRSGIRPKGLGPKAAVARGARIVRLRMPSRRAAVAPTVERIVAAVGRAGLDQEQKDNLAVAVAEALSNAAVHGNRLKASANVLVAVETTPDGCAVVEIKDSGAGFDQSRLSDPTDNAHILMPGGRGVFLMRRLVDQLEYNHRGNCVRLTMHARNGHPGVRPGRQPKR